MIALPVDAILPQLCASLRRRGAVVLVAPPGSGKTTRVPPAVLDAGLAGGGRVVVLQPRRVAARLSARRIAAERGSAPGEEVGWRVRFENRTSARTRIEVVTEGMLTRLMQRDPFLEGIGAVILDEFHERSLHADLALALVARVRREAREDLSVVVMSATMDPEPVAAFLDCEVLETSGRTYPVTVHYDARTEARDPVDRTAPAVRRALAATGEGHVLTFLPGAGEIRRVARALSDLPASGVAVTPLHGGLTAAEQDRALSPSDPRAARKVVLATNIAETSVTLEGVRAVVDAGLVREPRFEVALGLDRLETVMVSRASADQRAGRAGRTGPGETWRLWTEATDRRLRASAAPEVQRADLTRAMLEALSWGGGDFPWYEAPPEAAVSHATGLLAMLGATRGQRVTALGEALLALPLHPRLGAIVIAGHRRGCLDDAAWMAALASERDPLRRATGAGPSDLAWRLEALRGGRLPYEADRSAAAAVARAAKQIARAARRQLGDAPQRRANDDELARLLLAGFPDRVARRRAPRSPRLKLVGGRGAELHPSSAVTEAPLLVAVDLELRERGADPVVRVAAAVDAAWLTLEDSVEQRFDPALERVVARTVTRYRDLVLREEQAPRPGDPERAAALLAEAAAADPSRALGPTPALDALRARVTLLRRVMPELELPALPDDAGLLAELCAGKRSFEALRRADPAEVALNRLSWKQRQALETHAPEQVRVATGAQVQVDYSGDRPSIAARIQQLFGMAQAPSVARGRVRCRVQLLAPNNRPAQVTDDLESFWANTYPQVRSELRGRYPRHAWPERPTAADAENRPRRRRR